MGSVGPQQSPSFWDSVYRPDQSTLEWAAEKYFDIEPENYQEKPNSKEKVYKEKQDYTMSNWGRGWNIFLRVILFPVTLPLLAVKYYNRKDHVYQIDNWETYQAKKIAQNATSKGTNPSTVAHAALQTQSAKTAEVEKTAKVDASEEALKKRADDLFIFCKILRTKAHSGAEFLDDAKAFKNKPAQDQIDQMKAWIQEFAKNGYSTARLDFNPKSRDVQNALKHDEIMALEKWDTVPEELGLFVYCTELSLSNLPLKTFPPSILQLTNLTQLFLYNTQLTEIPEEIAKLENLERLNIHDNQLSTLPDSFQFLHKLDMLEMAGNQFTGFPEPLLHLPKLAYVNISENGVTRLPEAISSMPNLVQLVVGVRPVREEMTIPDSIRTKIVGDDNYKWKSSIRSDY